MNAREKNAPSATFHEPPRKSRSCAGSRSPRQRAPPGAIRPRDAGGGVEEGARRAGAARRSRAGHDLFGENYAQELRDKAREVAGARWHFIGPLQRNKVKYVVGVAELIHSVDSPSLLDEIAARADKLGVVQRCLVQVNVGDEAQKSGCAVADVPALVRAFAARPSVRCEGLMCIPPDGAPPRPFFDNLAMLAKAEGLRELSMGMSERLRRGDRGGGDPRARRHRDLRRAFPRP